MQYVPASELAGLPGFPGSARRAREAAARMGLPSRPRGGRGGGLEYAIDALPPAARLALAARLTAANDAQPIRTASVTESRANGTARSAHATGWQKEWQDSVARVLVLFQRFWQAYGGPLTPALTAFCHVWAGGLSPINVTVPDDLRRTFPRLNYKSLRTWHLGVQERGLAAITPREHHRKGKFAALAGDVGAAVLALLVDKPHLSATAIYSAVATQFPDIPSERAFRRALAHWKDKNAQLFEAVTNPDSWRNKYLSAAGSASEGITRPNQLWQMDSTTGDVMLADGRRHAVVGVIDVFTRRRLFLVTRTSRSGAIMSLIRRAIAAWGVPAAIKTDNGQDYVAAQLDAALLGLGIEHPLCQPFSPQQKPHIERAIGALMQEYFELLEGYVGHSVADRKAIEARRAFSDRLFDKEEPLDLRMTPEQLQAGIDAYCAKLHASTRPELGGRTPEQMALRHPIATVPERALDVLLAPSAEGGIRTVGKKGIRIGGGFYNHAHLGGLEGRQVQVKVDEANLGRCWVFDLDGAYVCEALDYERLGFSSAEVAAERKAHQAKALRESKRELKAVTRKFDTRAAIQAIHATRTEEAVAASPNVVPLRRTAAHSSTGIDSITTADTPKVSDEQLAAAQAALAARAEKPAPVITLHATPQERYARWLQLEARVQAGEALAAEERNWFEGYANGPEWGAQKRFFEVFGLTPEQVLGTQAAGAA
ncbi:Mu transposase C-terminal domain-containing protein [Xenophilus aerolatus]|nr:Mu transposase C-terminal domain-containing protein [Xenophilus aerolatus]